jgi:hypothetical protein
MCCSQCGADSRVPATQLVVGTVPNTLGRRIRDQVVLDRQGQRRATIAMENLDAVIADARERRIAPDVIVLDQDGHGPGREEEPARAVRADPFEPVPVRRTRRQRGSPVRGYSTGVRVIATRRFWSRPWGLVLEAAGWASPIDCASMRLRLTPFATRKRETSSARR